jgi:hypothetical protein
MNNIFELFLLIYRLVPNYAAKTKNGRETFVGSEIDDCKDFSGLFYNLAFHRVKNTIFFKLIKKNLIIFL